MPKSPKKYLVVDGKVVEAKPGLSGTLLVAEGAEISEADAKKYGIPLAPPEHHPTLVPPVNQAKEPSKTEAQSAAKPWDSDPASGLPKTLEFGKVKEKPSPLPLEKPEG